MNRLSLVTRAVRLGDAETLVPHLSGMTHSTYVASATNSSTFPSGWNHFQI